MAVRLRDGADRDLAHLRPAPHDDDALAVDALEGLDDLEAPHHGRAPKLRQQGARLSRQVDLEIDARLSRRALDDLDRGDVAAVRRDDAGELVKDAGSALRADRDPDGSVAHLGAPVEDYR